MNTEPKQRKAIVQRKRVRPTEKARPEEVSIKENARAGLSMKDKMT